MKKILLGIFVVVILIVIGLVFGRNILARTIAVNGIKQACGLKIDIAKVEISLPRVAILGLKIYNPAGFNDKVLADIPEVSFDFDLPGFFKNKIHLRKFKLDVHEMNVVLNEQGKLNVNSLALLIPKKGGGTPPEVKIDELAVKIGKVSYKGYFPVAGVNTMEFNPGVNETFRDVTDPAKVATQIVQRIISKIGIGGFADFAIKGGVDKVSKELGVTATKTMNDAAKEIKGLFDVK